MAIFWIRAALSVNHILLCLSISLGVSHFGFDGRTLDLITSVPVHCIPFTFNKSESDYCSLSNLC